MCKIKQLIWDREIRRDEIGDSQHVDGSSAAVLIKINPKI